MEIRTYKRTGRLLAEQVVLMPAVMVTLRLKDRRPASKSTMKSTILKRENLFFKSLCGQLISYTLLTLCQ